jgi:hypothetical protein
MLAPVGDNERARRPRYRCGPRFGGPEVLDPQAVLSQAGQGRAPATWRVFTKDRGRVRGFLRGTSADPDPLLVITTDGAVEYVDSKKPTAVVDFGDLSGVRLRVTGSTFSDSIHVRLDVWLDLRYRDGRKSKWRSASFASQYQTIQAFIEAYGAHQALRSGGLDPH